LQQIAMNGERSNNFLYRSDEGKLGFSLPLQELACLNTVTACSPAMGQDAKLLFMVSPEIKVAGVTYLHGTVLINGWSDVTGPDFVEIVQIVVHQDLKFLVCRRLQVVDFFSHMNAFTVTDGNDELVLQTQSLFNVWPQVVCKLNNIKHVILQCTDDVWAL
jgi:hypothetical protein